MKNFLKNDLIAEYVWEDYKWAFDYREDRSQDWLRYYQLYKNYVRRTDYPYASNLSIPTATTIVDVQVAYILAAIFESDLFAQALGRTDLGQWSAPSIDALMDYHFRHSLRIYEDISALVRQLCLYGTSIYKLYWEAELGWRRVEMPVYRDRTMEEETQMIEVPTLIKNRPRGYPVDMLSFFVDPHASCLADARYCGEDLWVPIEDLAEMAERKVIDQAAFKMISPDSKRSEINRGLRLRYESIGLPSFQDSPFVVRNRVHVVDYYGYMSKGWGKENVSSRGYKKKLIHVLAALPGEYGGGPPLILKAEDIPFNHGRFPYVDFRLEPTVGEFYGVGDIEKTESLLLEQRDTRNMRMDTMNRFIHRMFKVLAGKVKNEKELFWRPGGIIHLENLDDVAVLDPGNIDPAYFQNEDRLKQDIDSATGVNDFVIGQYTSGSGFNDTATGISTIQEAALRRVQEKVNIVQRGIKDIAYLMFNLIGQYMPYGTATRVMDRNEAIGYRFVDISPEALREEYDFVAVSGPSLGTKQARVSNLIQILQLAIQMKQVDPQNFQIDFRRFFDRILKEAGTPNPNDLLGHPNLGKPLPNLPGSITGRPDNMLSPEEENRIMVEQKQLVMPHFNDDHPDHRMIHHAAYEATDDTRVKEILAEHDRAHMEYIRMQQEIMANQINQTVTAEGMQRDLESMAYMGAGGNTRGAGPQAQENMIKRRASAMAGAI